MMHCDIHPEVTFPEGYTCPVCQRMDQNIVKILRQLIEIRERLGKIEQELGRRKVRR